MKKVIKEIIGQRTIDLFRRLFPSDIQRKATDRSNEESLKRSLFYGSFVQKGALCFDVGANVGNRIAPLLRLGARVVAVEPQEVCYSYLKKKFGRKIHLVTKGLGAKEGMQTFHLSSGSPMSSFSEEWINSVKEGRFKEYNWDRTVQVEMTTLDKLIADYGIPDFIKIDVEGYEMEVLKGLSHVVPMISFEYTTPEQKDKPALCLELIEKHNPAIECNYSIGESMEFAEESWMSLAKMKTFLLSDSFMETGFGDIYVRSIRS